MNSIKSIVSGLTAAALVAGIGIVYAQSTTPAPAPEAQSTTDPATAPATKPDMSATPQPNSAATTSSDSTTAPSPASNAAPLDSATSTQSSPTTSDASVERAPQADRN